MVALWPAAPLVPFFRNDGLFLGRSLLFFDSFFLEAGTSVEGHFHMGINRGLDLPPPNRSPISLKRPGNSETPSMTF